MRLEHVHRKRGSRARIGGSEDSKKQIYFLDQNPGEGKRESNMWK